MGGANPNNEVSIQPLHAIDPRNRDGRGFQDATYQHPWRIDSAHPEKVTEGMAQGVSNFAQGISSAAGAYKGATPNASSGYNSVTDAQQAAPYAYGYSRDGSSYYPQAKGVNYQPDQMERLYGYNY